LIHETTSINVEREREGGGGEEGEREREREGMRGGDLPIPWNLSL